MNTLLIVHALFAHFVNDFVGQNCLFPSLKIGENKSKNDAILLLHVVLYTFGMFLMMCPLMSWNTLVWFTVINGVTHLVIDAVTSVISSIAYEHKNYRVFWITIGLDQFLHTAILVASLS